MATAQIPPPKGHGFSTNGPMLHNWWPVPSTLGRSDSEFRTIPGSHILSSAPDVNGVGCRGSFISATGPESDGFIGSRYICFGDSIFRIKTDDSLVRVGRFNSISGGAVSWAENQAQGNTDVFIYVCDGVTIYKFSAKAEDADIASTFSELPNLPFCAENSSQYIKPRFLTWDHYRLIVTASNSSAWYYSETGTDTLSSDQAYFGESRNDKTQRVIAFGGNVISFGRYSYDLFSWTGESDDPYAASNGLAGSIGLSSPDGIAIVGNSLVWLGSGPNGVDAVWAMSPNMSITKISDNDTEKIIGSWASREYARAFSISVQGSDLFVIGSVNDGYTMCYDLTNNVWFRAGETANGKMVDWKLAHPVLGYYGEMIAGALDSNDLLSVGGACVSHNGNPIVRLMQTPHQVANGKPFQLARVIPDFDPGLGQSPVDYCEAFVQWSWSFGKEWEERMVVSLGKLGDYMNEIGIFGGGFGTSIVLRIGTSDPVPVTLYNVVAELN